MKKKFEAKFKAKVALEAIKRRKDIGANKFFIWSACKPDRPLETGSAQKST